VSSRFRPNFPIGVRLGVSVMPLIYFLSVRILSIPNYDSIGILPYKDAAAWKLCAKALSLTGSFPDGYGNWCNRRPFFAEFSGLLFRLAGSDFAVLLIFTLLFCASLYFLMREISALLGVLSQVIVISLSLSVWLLFGANLFLSESLAIPMGLTLTSLILNFIRTQSIDSLSYAAFTISLLQSTRPSNFFVVLVPLFMLTIYKKIRQGILPVLVSTISPFLLIFLAGKITRISEYNNAGNAWATLYGLFHKNSDWTLAYTKVSQSSENSDYEISKRVEELVLADLREGPLQSAISFMTSVVSNLKSMFISDHLFFLPDNLAIPHLGKLLSIILFLFIVLRLIKFKSNSPSWGLFALVLSVTATTILSYATYWKSEAPRVLSSSLIFSLTALLIASNCSTRSLQSSARKGSSLKIVVAMMCAITMGVLSINSNHSERNLLGEKPLISCADDEFYFLDNSITTQSVKKVKFFGLFEWEEHVRDLGDGYLSQGIGTFGGGIHSIQTYSQFKPLPNRCYQFSSDGGGLPGLIKLGFGYSS
jgi:hypothetical protein